jgi:hypothetical protein
MIENEIINNPTVNIGWFEWREPVTCLTDFTIALVCLFAFVTLTRSSSVRLKNFNFYRAYFLCFTLGMTSAAWLGHGLVAYVGVEWKAIGWITSIIGYFFLGTASLMEIKEVTKKSAFRVLNIAFYAQIAVYLFLLLNPYTRDFKLAQLGAVTSLIVFILPMHLHNYFKTKAKGSLLVAISILCGILPAIVYNTQFSISNWFNYHDISHVLVAINMYITYRGVKLLALQSSSNQI